MKPDGSPSVKSGKMVLAIVTVLTVCALAVGITQFFVPGHHQSRPTRLREGIVYDAVTGQPVPGAKIVVTELVEFNEKGVPLRSPLEVNTISNAEGRFFIDIPEHWVRKGYHVLVDSDNHVMTSIGVSPDQERHIYFDLYAPLVRPIDSYSFYSLPEQFDICICPVSHASERPIESWWKKYHRDWFVKPDMSRGWKKHND